MNNQLNKLIQKGKQVSLSKEEKQGMKNNILAFMANHPAKDKSPYWQTFAFYFRKAPVAAFSVFILTAGLLHQAEASLPGDPLYGLKTNVNEEILGLVTTNPENKLVWEIRRIEKRLDEVKALSGSKELDTRRIAVAEDKFDQQINNISERIANLEDQDGFEDLKDRTLSQLQRSLSDRSQSLHELKEIAGENGEVDMIISKINQRLAVVDKEKTQIQIRENLVAEFDKLNDQIEGLINEEEKETTEEGSEEPQSIKEELAEIKTEVEKLNTDKTLITTLKQLAEKDTSEVKEETNEKEDSAEEVEDKRAETEDESAEETSEQTDEQKENEKQSNGPLVEMIILLDNLQESNDEQIKEQLPTLQEMILAMKEKLELEEESEEEPDDEESEEDDKSESQPTESEKEED